MRNDKGSVETRLEIQKLNELPPLSPVVNQFMRAVQNEDIGLGELAHIIEQDPALLARIIGLANSAYFGSPERITSAEEAIIKVLGLNTTKSIALGIVLSGPFDASRCPNFDAERYWLSAVFCASLCQRLAPLIRSTDAPSPSEGYLGGLIYNLGLLALVHLYPNEMGGAFAGLGENMESLHLVSLEQDALGVDHLEVGGWLGRRWHLPEAVVEVMENRLRSDYQGQYRSLVRLVAYGASLAKHVVFQVGERPDVALLEPLGLKPQRAEELIEQQIGRMDELRELARIMAD